MGSGTFHVIVGGTVWNKSICGISNPKLWVYNWSLLAKGWKPCGRCLKVWPQPKKPARPSRRGKEKR